MGINYYYYYYLENFSWIKKDELMRKENETLILKIRGWMGDAVEPLESQHPQRLLRYAAVLS